MKKQPRIVLGITGSIAATKAQSIALALMHQGFEVRACLSHSALKVIGLPAIASVLGSRPYANMWDFPDGSGEPHIELANWADAMLIAPATASCIGSLANGLFDNVVTLVAGNLPFSKIYFAPAMSSEMWNHPAVEKNVKTLKGWGAKFLGPVEGRVASGLIGQRLLEPRELAVSMGKEFL